MNCLILDAGSVVPAYIQIQDQIRGGVRQGTLRPGAPLPSVRQLAADLGINPNTVAKAYMLLEREGILQTLPRRGTLVAESAPDKARRLAEDRLGDVVDRFLEQAEGLGLSGRQLLQAMKRRIEGKPVSPPARRKEVP
jgi:GntR family transcriptional regulator